MKKTLLLISACAVLSACGATTSLDTEMLSQPIAAGKSRITVTRDTSLLYLALPTTVTSNGAEIASLGRGGGVVYNIPAGENVLQVSTPTSFGKFVVHFNAESQKTYNFKASPKGKALFVDGTFGIFGDAVDAQISDRSGFFKLELLP